MAVISFSKKPEQQWVAAGWAFRQVLDDTLSQRPEDAEMAQLFAESKHRVGLVLYLLKPELAARIAGTMRAAAEGILAGTLRSGIHDKPCSSPNTADEYRKGLQQLLDAIPFDWAGGPLKPDSGVSGD